MKGIFGWSLPPRCHRLPGEEEELPIALKCPQCGRFISMKETRMEPWKETVMDWTENKVILAAGATSYYNCKRCGEISEPTGVFA